jgi:hypothetical protein
MNTNSRVRVKKEGRQQNQQKRFTYTDISEWFRLGWDLGVFDESRQNDPKYVLKCTQWVDRLKEWDK